MQPKALIFDIDGTLLDSVDLHAQAWQEAFSHFGQEIPVAEIRTQIGKGGDQLLPVFLGPDQIQAVGKLIEQFRGDLFKRKYLPRVKAFPAVRALFEKAIATGQRVALASSAKGDEIEQYERIAGIEDLVHTEVSSSDAEKSKPHPDIFEAALERLGKGFDRSEVVVIGDSPYDAEAARRASLQCVGVRCGGFPEESLRQAGCSVLYDDPADLLRNYDSSPLAR